MVIAVYRLQGRRSLVLHLVQDGDDHVKLGSLCRVFVHAEPHQLTNMRRNPWGNGWPKTFKSNLQSDKDPKSETEKALEYFEGMVFVAQLSNNADM